MGRWVSVLRLVLCRGKWGSFRFLTAHVLKSSTLRSSLYHGRPNLLYQKKLGGVVGDFEWSGIYCEPPCCLRRTSQVRAPSKAILGFVPLPPPQTSLPRKPGVSIPPHAAPPLGAIPIRPLSGGQKHIFLSRLFDQVLRGCCCR